MNTRSAKHKKCFENVSSCGVAVAACEALPRTSALVENDLLGLEGFDDEPYGAGEQVGLAPDLLGKRQLIQRPDADLLQRAACAFGQHLSSVSCASRVRLWYL